MNKAACRFPVALRGRGNRCALAVVCILSAAVLMVSIKPAWSGKAPSRNRPPPPTSMPLDEVLNNIAVQQSRIDSLNAIRNRLKQDSAAAVGDLSQRGAALSKKQAEVDDGIAKKKTAAAGARSRYDKSLQDSAAIVAKMRDQMDRVRRDIARVDQSVIAVSTDLAALTGRTIESGVSPGDEKTIARMKAQSAQYDSLIRARQADLNDLSARRSKLRQDSVDIETRLVNDRNRFRKMMYPFDSLSLLCDDVIRQAEQKLAGDQANRDREAAQAKGNLALMTKQKKEYDDVIRNNNTDIATCSVERQKLAQSAGSAQQKYEQLRAPYDKALNTATADVQRMTRDKPLLKTLRQKLRLDSAIAGTRNNLDKAIQMSAENKRGAKKLVEQRSNELDSLEAERDLLVRGTQGLRQVEASIRGVSISQKMMFTDSAIATIDKKTAAAADRLNKARRDLEDFDRKNPPVGNAASMRIAQLDTMVSQKKKESIRMMDLIDSLNMSLQDLQGKISQLSSPAQAFSQEKGKLIKDKKAEKTSLADKRSKVQKDSAQNEIGGANAMTRVKNDVASLVSQWSRTQAEIDRITAERDKTRQALASLVDKNREARNTAQAAKRKNDSLVSAKQQELASLSAQSDKLRQDSAGIVRQQDLAVKGLSPSPSSLLASLSSITNEINGLQAQSDSLKKLALAGQGRTNEEAKRLSQQIASVDKTIDNINNVIAGLNDQKKLALSRLESDRRFYDSLIGTAERQYKELTAELDKVRQDSAAAETYIGKAMQKISSVLREHDVKIALLQKAVADAAAELARVRDDSMKIAERIANPPPQTGAPSIKNIDSVMEVRAKELSNLQTRREKAVLDSVKESEHCITLLSAAHNEIVKKGIALEQRKNELSLVSAVAGGSKYMDPLERSYRDALAAASTEITSQNEVIKKKKSEIARLRTVRDALSGATEDAGGGDSRIGRDKAYYDSLLSIAGQELAAIVARRDIARQDSAAAEVGIKQALKDQAPVQAPERGVAAIQKDVVAATADYERAVQDSAKIANAIPNTMQPFAQSIRTVDALITVKEKELAALQDMLDQTSRDGSTTSKRNAEQLAAAHDAIVQKKKALDRKNDELAQAAAAKNAAQNDADPSVRNYKQTLDAAKLQINVQNEQIVSKKDEITRLQKIRDAITARIKQPVAPPTGRESRTVAVVSPKENAQKLSEGIYVLVGENRIDDAASAFSKNQPFLKANLDDESFQALKMTITEMGGKIK